MFLLDITNITARYIARHCRYRARVREALARDRQFTKALIMCQTLSRVK